MFYLRLLFDKIFCLRWEMGKGSSILFLSEIFNIFNVVWDTFTYFYVKIHHNPPPLLLPHSNPSFSGQMVYEKKVVCKKKRANFNNS